MRNVLAFYLELVKMSRFKVSSNLTLKDVGASCHTGKLSQELLSKLNCTNMCLLLHCWFQTSSWIKSIKCNCFCECHVLNAYFCFVFKVQKVCLKIWIMAESSKAGANVLAQNISSNIQRITQLSKWKTLWSLFMGWLTSLKLFTVNRMAYRHIHTHLNLPRMMMIWTNRIKHQLSRNAWIEKCGVNFSVDN